MHVVFQEALDAHSYSASADHADSQTNAVQPFAGTGEYWPTSWGGFADESTE